jgi:TolB-like protein/Flp pilus assembly protein TadD/predicted Ser/Thr protein kinase
MADRADPEQLLALAATSRICRRKPPVSGKRVEGDDGIPARQMLYPCAGGVSLAGARRDSALWRLTPEILNMSPADAHLIGRTLGHYRIERRLGGGGMGVVYAARDTHLSRLVAVKVLPRDAVTDRARRARFVREARSASALNHPNIVTVHDVAVEGDVDFIAMEYVDGKPLSEVIRDGLSVAEAIPYATQIAAGLAAAHEAGIVHRDLKPANIMITRTGLVKLLDFGLAKLTEPRPDETTAPTESLALRTEAGIVMGTAPYMSPEQAAGKPTDARSDIFAFGAVLYEMVTGRRAFDAPTDVETLGRVLKDDPRPAGELTRDLPPDLERVIDRCLRKDPERRAQHMGDVKLALEDISFPAARTTETTRLTFRALWWKVALAVGGVAVATWLVVLGAGLVSNGPPAIERIAVLPLDNISGNPEQDYFANGMTEALINKLGRIGALRVTSRTSVMRYADQDEPPLRDIASALGVDAVVDGSAMRVGDEVRVTAHLVDARTDEVLWSDSYDRPLTDTLRLQSDIAQSIAEAIRVAVTPEETRLLASARSVDPEAYEYYLRGLHAFNFGPAEANRALEYFQLALDRDPDYAPPYTGIADIWGFRGVWGLAPQSQTAPQLREAAEKALALDDSLAIAHSVAAKVAFYADWDWNPADREFQRAVALDPSNAAIRFDYGLFLGSLRRREEAATQLERARELDPLNPMYIAAPAILDAQRGRYEAAVPTLRTAIAGGPELPPLHRFLWGALTNIGDFDAAIDEARRFHQALGDADAAAALVAPAPGRQGYQAAMRRAAEVMVARSTSAYASPIWIAQLYSSAGDTEQALDWLGRAFESRNPWMTSMRDDPFWIGLRDEPRFEQMVRQMNFPE